MTHTPQHSLSALTRLGFQLFLDKKLSKNQGLTNICCSEGAPMEQSLNKSLSAIPSRVKGFTSMKVTTTLLGLLSCPARAGLFESAYRRFIVFFGC